MKQITFSINEKAQHYAVRESFKTIRANLLFCSNEMKTIIVTSCRAHEGKTTSSIEIAASLAEINKKVLLVDADLRKASLRRRMNEVPDETMLGLSQYLSGQASLEDILYATQHPNLHVIFGGHCPPNPSELLGSRMVKELMDSVKDQYDYILFDTAPIGLVIDAAMLAPYCDGAIFVISVDEVSAKYAVEAKDQLEKAGCHIAGVILNEAKQNTKTSILRKKYKYYTKRYGKRNKGTGVVPMAMPTPTVVNVATQTDANGRALLFTTDTSVNSQTAIRHLDEAKVSYETVQAKQETDMVKAYEVSLVPTLVVLDGENYTKYEGVASIIRYANAKKQ